MRNHRSFKIAPSILSADFSKLGEEVEALTKAGADLIHVDVMDGHFVPNLTLGPDVVQALARHTSLPLSVHLMVDPVQPFIRPFAEAGAHHLIFHVETKEIQETITLIRQMGKKVGLAINPETPVELLFPYLSLIDMVLVMTVHPGFGGQSFMEGPLEKIGILHEHLQTLGLSVEIAVDGGINLETAPKALDKGATVLAVGTAIFKEKDYKSAIQGFKQLGSRFLEDLK